MIKVIFSDLKEYSNTNSLLFASSNSSISFYESYLMFEIRLTREFHKFQNSAIEKAFLFDVVSKIYIATDSSPVDMQSYELCCDMIDVVIDVSCIYGSVSLAVR